MAEVVETTAREGGVADLGIVEKDEVGIEVGPTEGSPPGVTSIYDDQGRPLSETYEYDTDGDGVIDYRQTTDYEYDGANISSLSYTEDRGADGTIDYRNVSSSSYDANGQLLANTTEIDFNGDGVADYRDTISYTYDDAGRTTSYKSANDANGDGIADSMSWASYAYDISGQMTSTSYASDTNGDGVVDQTSTETYTFDANGVITASVSTSDEDGDGVANQAYSYAYAYNDDGSQASSAFTADYDGDGDIDYASVDHYAYDDQGGLLTVTSEIDDNGDGIVDQTIVSDVQIVTIDGVPVATDDLIKSDADIGGSAETDQDRSGQDDTVDMGTEVIHTLGGFVMGDVNADGRFNSADLSLIFQAGQYEDDVAGNSTWETGDWDGDGDFTTVDLILAMQFGAYEGDAQQALLPDVGMEHDSAWSDRLTSNAASATDEAFADDSLDLYALSEIEGQRNVPFV